MIVNQHRQVYEEWKRIVAVHWNKVHVKDDDDEDGNDEDDGTFEENEELIDMLHVAWMKEKLKHHCLKRKDH